MKYYDLKKNWPKVLHHLNNQELNARLVRDFDKYTSGRWNIKFNEGKYPRDYETYDWDKNHRGTMPAFWKYVKHNACHWIVNFTLHLATLTEPEKPWRIITSERHSTVWDRENMLFDFNFQAMGISPEECYKMAFERELEPGEYLEVHLAQHCSLEF